MNDGHSSHKTLDVINFCRDHNIHLISSPPHTTHKLQPSDRTFMKPFKTAYYERCDLWMRENAGARITVYDIAGLVREAFIKVARLEIAASGFRCTGIYPLDRNIFSDIDYLGCEMTNIPHEEMRNQQDFTFTMGSGDPKEKNEETLNVQPSTSPASHISKVILKVSPLPDATKRITGARARRCERSEILTSSPNKLMTEEKENKKRMTEQIKNSGNKRKTTRTLKL